MYHNVLVNLDGFFALLAHGLLVIFCGLLHLAATKIAVKCNQLHFVASYISRLYRPRVEKYVKFNGQLINNV